MYLNVNTTLKQEIIYEYCFVIKPNKVLRKKGLKAIAGYLLAIAVFFGTMIPPLSKVYLKKKVLSLIIVSSLLCITNNLRVVLEYLLLA